MWLDLFFLAAGLALLFAGAELLVRGAAALALRGGISPLVVGLTVVAFGTSAPELVVSVQAALDGVGGIAAGNVVGSNIANVGLILGVAAMIRPLRVEAQLVRLDMPLLIGASGLLAFLLWDQALARSEGLLLLAGFFGYVGFTLWMARRNPLATPDEPLPSVRGTVWRDLGFVLAGLAALVLGSQGLVRGAVAIAEAAGLPPAVIGLTLVAVGTSLPELATSAVAAYRGAGDLAIGNVVGSNLFNALGILGTAAVVRPLDVSGLDGLNLGTMLLMAVLMLPLAWSGFVLSRREGALLVVLYSAYTVLLLG